MTPRPTTFQTASLDIQTIKTGQNANLTVEIKNNAVNEKSVELHIVYDTTKIVFYDKTNKTLLPDPVWNGRNYTIIHPKKGKMSAGTTWGIGITIRGLDPGISYAMYPITLELYSDNQFSQKTSVTLRVEH